MPQSVEKLDNMYDDALFAATEELFAVLHDLVNRHGTPWEGIVLQELDERLTWFECETPAPYPWDKD